MVNFVSLHNQTSYSILDSLVSPKELLKRAKELGQPAVAITDHGSIGAAWEALKASRELGIKLIIGCECYFVDDAKNTKDKFRHVIFLAKNAIGYRNLLTINKKGFDQGSFLGKRVYPIVDWKLLEQHSEGLICLTACGNGIVSQLLMNKQNDAAIKTLLRLKGIFGDNLGLEVQPNNMKRFKNAFNDEIDQQFLNRRLIDLGKEYGIKVVPACNTHYLKKEDAAVHDVFLAIGSHQPVHSSYRLKYSVPDFYLKSGDEVAAFFARNYGEDYAKQLCENTISFSDMCEDPEWIDPKFSNPSGKELPIFPVKDEPDYNAFCDWVLLQSDTINALSEDKQFLRYKCEANFDGIKDINDSNRAKYKERLDEELDVIEFHGFSSYMLIVADYIAWARKNDIAVGEGRGCLTGDTMVLTTNGFKYLKDIEVGENVYTHTGKSKKVLNTFKFSVKGEPLVKLSSNYAFQQLTMTRDHKIYGDVRGTVEKEYNYSYGKITYNKVASPRNHQWIKCEDLNKLDYIYSTFPLREMSEAQNIDLARYNKSYHLYDDCFHQTVFSKNEFSIRKISKNTGVSFEFVRKLKNKQVNGNENDQFKTVSSYLNNNFSMSVNDWVNIENKEIRKINRFLAQDEDFMYLLGRWVGDGSLHHDRGISIVFNSKDTFGISKIKTYLKSLGFYVCEEGRGSNVLLTVSNSIIYNLFVDLFSDYNLIRNANAKHLPISFRELNNELLASLISGLIDSDGHTVKSTNNFSIKTVSKRLALEIKEVCLFLRKPSVIYHSKCKRYDIDTQDAYTIEFNYDKTQSIDENGFYHKVSKIEKVFDEYVYDITVEDDHSYLTTNGVVHNSVGGSLIGYLLNIHKSDPIKYDLIFARFHNKEKTSFPDIDADFAPSGRYRVQKYLSEKYGDDHVAHVSNVNTITPKVYIRDIARSCELGGSREDAVRIGNDISECVSADIHSIDEAINKAPLFSEYCKKYTEFLTYKEICGKYRALSTHAGGIVISARSLTGLVPLRRDKDGSLVLEYDKDKAEENGLIKMDILGLSTLDVISETYNIIKSRGKEVPDDNMDFDIVDSKTYDLISRGDTFCVFQFGTSAGTIDLCKRVKPENINDLANINALARPSSRGMRNDFIKTRDGKMKMSLLHPNLGRAFNSTYGFGLYEECLMYLAQDIAGWSLHSSDRLRKLTKEKGKNPKKAEQWRTEFISDSIKNNISEDIAKRIWMEVVELFLGYGFNKSHAILYSMIGYKTAYLKAHYPIEFLLANLMAEVRSNSPDAKSNIEVIKKELKAHDVKLSPPDINSSELTYTISDGNKLLTGLDALKFVGDDAIKDIIEKRPFVSFFDFMSRVDSKKVRSNNIQALAASGAMDSFNIPRKSIVLYCADYRKKLTVWLKKHDPKAEEFVYPWPKENNWSVSEIYAQEQFYLAESFSCKPYEAYGNFFKDEHITVSEIKKSKDKTKLYPIKVIIRSFFEFKVKKETSKYYGMPMIKAVIEDKNGDQCSCTIFPDRWKAVQDYIKKIKSKAVFDVGIALSFAGNVNTYEDNVGVILDDIYDVSPIPARPADLVAKKVNLKAAKSSKVEKDLFDDIEDDMINEGKLSGDEDEGN